MNNPISKSIRILSAGLLVACADPVFSMDDNVQKNSVPSFYVANHEQIPSEDFEKAKNVLESNTGKKTSQFFFQNLPESVRGPLKIQNNKNDAIGSELLNELNKFKLSSVNEAKDITEEELTDQIQIELKKVLASKNTNNDKLSLFLSLISNQPTIKEVEKIVEVEKGKPDHTSVPNVELEDLRKQDAEAKRLALLVTQITQERNDAVSKAGKGDTGKDYTKLLESAATSYSLLETQKESFEEELQKANQKLLEKTGHEDPKPYLENLKIAKEELDKEKKAHTETKREAETKYNTVVEELRVAKAELKNKETHVDPTSLQQEITKKEEEVRLAKEALDDLKANSILKTEHAKLLTKKEEEVKLSMDPVYKAKKEREDARLAATEHFAEEVHNAGEHVTALQEELNNLKEKAGIKVVNKDSQEYKAMVTACNVFFGGKSADDVKTFAISAGLIEKVEDMTGTKLSQVKPVLLELLANNGIDSIDNFDQVDLAKNLKKHVEGIAKAQKEIADKELEIEQAKAALKEAEISEQVWNMSVEDLVEALNTDGVQSVNKNKPEELVAGDRENREALIAKRLTV